MVVRIWTISKTDMGSIASGSISLYQSHIHIIFFCDHPSCIRYTTDVCVDDECSSEITCLIVFSWANKRAVKPVCILTLTFFLPARNTLSHHHHYGPASNVWTWWTWGCCARILSQLLKSLLFVCHLGPSSATAISHQYICVYLSINICFHSMFEHRTSFIHIVCPITMADIYQCSFCMILILSSEIFVRFLVNTLRVTSLMQMHQFIAIRTPFNCTTMHSQCINGS